MYFLIFLLKPLIEIREIHTFLTKKIFQILEIVCLNYLDYFNHLNGFTSWNVLNREEPVLFQNFKEWVSLYLSS